MITLLIFILDVGEQIQTDELIAEVETDKVNVNKTFNEKGRNKI